MSRRRHDRAPCPIARAAAVAGDEWTLLLLRNVSFGQRRFGELARALGAPRASLSRRLARLVEDGLLARRRYQERPPRDEYELTEKGRAFGGVLAALWRFGEDWMFRGGAAPVTLVDRRSGRPVRPIVVDEATRAPLDLAARRARYARAER
jgi:DNA-binding HxlR family transcriptional regulator